MNSKAKNPSNRKKIIIIGAGISGLAAGSYAQKAGYDTEIYEKHSVPGGECTGWDRKGYHIDGCIHWLTGTSPSDPLNKVWRDVGALSDSVRIHQPESFCVVEQGGQTLSLYEDFDKLRTHLLAIAPDDREELEKLFAAIQVLYTPSIPQIAPDQMNPLEMIRMIASMGKQQKVIKSMMMPLKEYVLRFKNPTLHTALISGLPADQCAYVLAYTLATVLSGNGGRPEGGSRGMALRMADYYRSLGGTLHLATPVDEIIIKNGTAVGIRLADNADASKTAASSATADKSAGLFVAADHVLSAADVHTTLSRFLAGKFEIPSFAVRDADPGTYPSPTSSYVALGIDMDLSGMPPDLIVQTDPFTYEDKTLQQVSVKHFCYEPSFAPEGHSVIGLFFFGNYDWWKALMGNEALGDHDMFIQSPAYLVEKERLIKDVIRVLENRFPEWKGHLIPLDVSTPLTYERYCDAYRGQWMSYGPTQKGKRLMHFGKIKGIRNFSMCGQWLLPPGGLPTAVITAKWAIQRICKADKLSWRW